ETRSAKMASKKKPPAKKAGSKPSGRKRATSSVQDTSGSEQDAGDETVAIEDGKILDYITGNPVKENDKERVRQRIARALFHEYGINVDDMEPDFKVKIADSGRTSNKKIDIAIFEAGADHTAENVRRLV